MHAHEIEPVILLSTRLKELHVAVTERAEEPLISDIAHAIQSKLGVAFLEKDWLYGNAIRFGCSSVVIQ
jgi:hypothetical protein